jgi:hypothetical protein
MNILKLEPYVEPVKCSPPILQIMVHIPIATPPVIEPPAMKPITDKIVKIFAVLVDSHTVIWQFKK